MNRTSVTTALTATGVGMTLLLAGCGSNGSDSAANSASLSPAAGGSTASSTGAESEASSSAAADSSNTTSSQAKSSARTTGHGKTTTAAPPAAKPSSTTSAGDKPVALCSVKQLRITLGSGNADMQGSHRPLRFTNISNTVCKLTGAPGVSYVGGSNGHQLGKPAQRIVGHQPIVLIPNQTAAAGLFISSAPRKSACAQATARGIRVYPPDSYQAAFVALPEVTCTTGGPYLKVGPILPDADNTGV